MHRLFSMIGMSVVAIFCCVWQHVQWVEMGRNLTEKELVLQDLMADVRSMQLKEASLSSLERIERISINDLGLVRGAGLNAVMKSSDATKYLIAEKILTPHTTPGGSVLMPTFTTFADAGQVDGHSGRRA